MNDFNTAFDKLFRMVSVYDTSPDDEPWFFEKVNKLINEHGNEVAIEFAQNEKWPEYTFELLVKSGLREIPKEVLLPYLATDNEDNMYCTAFALAACGYEEGFEILSAFADGSHPLAKTIHPGVDILPDLSYIEDARVDAIKRLCRQYL
ncbi:hypothetical protein [Gilvibacter sediminis]|uniref:hypothetical protein n=1 Tax=Gilvibacter sediminis TaxID=379071 RepID=UPI00234FFC88|nr:hypothetical protein [Gilvibacter sediminis]MDC7997985.1 hypothetical protein [Gilvibacter sediminis]